MQKKIKILEKEIANMKKLLEDLQIQKKLELEEIEKEISEIFGGDDNEIQLLKMKAKRFRELSNSRTTEFLRDLYDKMNKEFYIPEGKTYEIPTANLDEFDQAMNKKFRLIQRCTANRVYKLIEGTKNRVSVDTQTLTKCIDPKEHEEIVSQVEKISIQYQSALIQLEKYTNDYESKSLAFISLEAEKNQFKNDFMKLKKEFEQTNREATAMQKENSDLILENENLKTTKVSLTSNISDLQLQINNLKARILTLDKKIENRATVHSLAFKKHSHTER